MFLFNPRQQKVKVDLVVRFYIQLQKTGLFSHKGFSVQFVFLIFTLQNFFQKIDL